MRRSLSSILIVALLGTGALTLTGGTVALAEELVDPQQIVTVDTSGERGNGTWFEVPADEWTCCNHRYKISLGGKKKKVPGYCKATAAVWYYTDGDLPQWNEWEFVVYKRVTSKWTKRLKWWRPKVFNIPTGADAFYDAMYLEVTTNGKCKNARGVVTRYEVIGLGD